MSPMKETAAPNCCGLQGIRAVQNICSASLAAATDEEARCPSVARVCPHTACLCRCFNIKCSQHPFSVHPV